jgi:hypothetical protein
MGNGADSLTTEGVLPDRSTWRVEPTGHCHSLISRIVGGTTVWGQVFGRQDDHDGQVLDVLAKMEADPDGFHFWWIPVTDKAGET